MISSISRKPTTASGWTTSTNVLVEDQTTGTAGTATAAATTTGLPVLVTGGYGSFSVPTDRTITGVSVRIKGGYQGRTTNVSATIVQTGKTSVAKPSQTQAAPITGATADLIFGGSTDLWGRTWTAADFEDASLGINVAPTQLSGGGNAYIDVIEVTVYYDVPGRYVTDRRPAIIRAPSDWQTPANVLYDDVTNTYGAYNIGGPSHALVLSFDLPFPTEAAIDAVYVWIKAYNPTPANTFTVRITQGGITTTCTEGYRAMTTALAWYQCSFARAFTADQLADPLLQVEILGAGPGGSGNMTNYLYVDHAFVRVISDHGVAVGSPAASSNITQEATGTYQWNTPTNMWKEDGATGYCTLGGVGTVSRDLWYDTLNFNMPADAMLLGVRFRAKCQTAAANQAKLQGTVYSVVRETTIPAIGVAPATSGTWITMANGFKDLWDGTFATYTPAMVNATSFAPHHKAVVLSGTSIQPQIDALEATVLYKQAPLALSFEHGFTSPLHDLPDDALYWPYPDPYKNPFQPFVAGDDFTDGVIAPCWNPVSSAAVTLSETGGALNFVAAVTAPTGNAVCAETQYHDLRGTETFMKIDQLSNVAGWYLHLYVVAQRSGYYYEVRYQNTKVDAWRTLDSVGTQIFAPVTASPTYFRFDHVDQWIAFYYTTGTAEQVRLGTAVWNQCGTEVVPASLSAAYFQIVATKTQGAVAGPPTFKVGDFWHTNRATGGRFEDRFTH